MTKTYAGKNQESKTHPVVTAGSRRQRDTEAATSITDNRPEALHMRKMQEMVSNSPQAKQAAQLQALADRHGFGQQTPVQRKEHDTGLPDPLKANVEQLSGYAMDDVRVHYHSAKPAAAGAYAYAQGTDIHLATGQERHLPHEAWHVVQQKQGRVKPNLQLKTGLAVNDSPLLEKEAELMGQKASTLTAPGNTSRNLATSLPAVGQRSKAVVQRKIWVGNDHKTHYDDALVTRQRDLTKPFLRQWARLDEIVGTGRRSTTAEAKERYLNNELENDIRAMLRKYNEKKAFDDEHDLTRQLVQDIKLKLLGLNEIIGIDHRDGQYSKQADAAATGRVGKTKTLRIYRTMKAEYWNNYVQSKNPKDILHGHGGSLGQALHYFTKSKAENLDDVLVEFAFSGAAKDLIDYNKIEAGGEGKGPYGGKLTGKNEQNDVMDLDKEIFSVNLGKSQDLIVALNPAITLKDKVRH